MSAEALGEPGLGASFVIALERGAVRPSMTALKALAERLEMPLQQLLNARTRLGRRSLPAYERDLAYQLDIANWMLHNNRIADALNSIKEAEVHAASYLRFLSAQITYRIPYLRGKAHYFAQRSTEAQHELERALRLLNRISRAGARAESIDREENVHALIQTHNILGICHYSQGHLEQAKDHHLLCRRLIAANGIKNPGLRLGVYRNLANDYWASGDFSLAISTYKEALALFDDLSDPQRKAGVHWGLSMSYKALDDLVFAAVHARQAVDLYTEAGAWGLAATMRLNLAEVLIANARYREAEEHLNKVSGWLQEPVPLPISSPEINAGGSSSDAAADSAASSHDSSAAGAAGAEEKSEAGKVDVERQEILLSVLYMNYGVLAWKAHDLQRAVDYIDHSVVFGEQAVASATRSNEAGGYEARTLAEALSYSAQIHEEMGDKEVCNQLFERALSVISTTEFEETYRTVAHAYAAVLETREDYKGATRMFRLAAGRGGRLKQR